MTKDDIIRMAREAQGTPYVNRHYPGVTSFGSNETTLEAFAKLVVANIDPKSFMSWQEGYEAGVVAEREACADAVEDVARKYQKLHHASLENIADECANAIRARGTT